MSRGRSRQTSALFGTPIAAAAGSVTKSELRDMAERAAARIRDDKRHRIAANLVQLRPSEDNDSEGKVLRGKGIDLVRELHELAKDKGPAGDSAREALAAIALAVVSPYRGRVVRQPRLLRFGSRIEEWLSGTVGHRVNRWTLPAGLARWWTWIGIGLTAVAAACLVKAWPQAALILLMVRLAVSATLPTPGLPADGGTASIWRISWSGCVAGHLSDAIALFGVSGYLLSFERAGWGFVVGLVPLVMLASTLLRVAALQDGIWIQRLYVERLLRSGTLIVGLVLAVVLQPEGPGTAFPVIVLSTSGAALFAAMEAARTIYYASERQHLDESDAEKLTRKLATVVEIDAKAG